MTEIKPGRPGFCQRCGAPLLSVRGGRKYCLDCQEVKNLESSQRTKERQTGIAYDAAPPRRVKRHRPPAGAMTINEIVREAARLGMSYGEYVAKYDPRKGPENAGKDKPEQGAEAVQPDE